MVVGVVQKGMKGYERNLQDRVLERRTPKPPKDPSPRITRPFFGAVPLRFPPREKGILRSTHVTTPNRADLERPQLSVTVEHLSRIAILEEQQRIGHSTHLRGRARGLDGSLDRSGWKRAADGSEREAV